MTETSSSPGAFAVLRGRDWRPLLLAVAILAAWARILVPGPAMAHGEAAAAQLCRAADGGLAQIPAADTSVTEADCSFCRLPELPAALPGPELRIFLAPLSLDAAPVRGFQARPVRSPRPVFARGPPSVAPSL